MTSRSGTSNRTGLGHVECDAYALCSDVLDLGWTAITPCRGCVIVAVATDLARAEIAGRATASPAQIVTADELEQLLYQARQPKISADTS